ncbi:MAG: UvrD-helicase domain-containing protein, partial [Oscillospiraceae bacterium]|nr:UvrD-helicase domain-containing protein [Oscillospiraceae bacterium]
YQDTNQVQNASFAAVSDEGRNLFEVGDVKQSIYRFRLADPSIFLEKYDAFAPAEGAEEGAPRKQVLSYNFRSRPQVLEGTNFVFEHIMSRAFGEMDYTDDQRLYPFPDLPYPEHPDPRLELDVVDMAKLPQPEDEARIRRDEVECDFIAHRIRQLLDEKFPVTEQGELRPVRAEDIVILHRSPNSILRRLTQALDRWRIPWSTDTAGDFFAAEEVTVAVSFLEIIDNPRQDVPLLSVLTSPVYHFTGSDLAQLRPNCREGDIYDCLCFAAEHGDGKSADFLTELERLRALAADQSGHRVLGELYDQVGMMLIYGAMEGGSARQANLRLLQEQARAFERGGHRGVFGLVTHLRRMREAGQSLAAPGKEAAGGVQILSIHKSKGLEFPVVLLAGLSHQFNRVDLMRPVLFHPRLGVGPKGLDTEKRIEYTTLARRAVALQLDKEMKAEELRLLYVAMTRAREKLILLYTTRDWAAAAQKRAGDAGAHPDPEALSALNCMGDWILLPALARPDAQVLREKGGVSCAALVQKDRWDVRYIAARIPDRTRVNKAEPGSDTRTLPPETLEALAWRYPYAALANVPSKATATQLKGRVLDEEAAEQTEQGGGDLSFRRPRFEEAERGLTPTQIGTAVHTVMQLIRPEMTGSAALVQEEIDRLVALECLTEEMGRAVRPERVAAFFASPLGRAALAADDLRREFKFSVLEQASKLDPSLPAGERVLLQGVIDCCFTGTDGLCVVDFKTDRIRPGQEAQRAEVYRTQMEVYTSALSRITGKPVAHRCLWFFATDTAWELK